MTSNISTGGVIVIPIIKFFISPFLPNAKITKGSFTVGIHLERNSSTPIYRQLDASLRRLILDGTLEPGQQLPSTRELAKDLSISRITVKAVYEQRAAESYVEAKPVLGLSWHMVWS